MVGIHDRTNYSKDSLFKNVHPHTHILNMHADEHSVEVQVPLNTRTEGETFPHQSHSYLHFCQGNPVGSWERAMALLSSEGPRCFLAFAMERKAFIVSGRCFSRCFMEIPFCFKFFVLDKQKD